MLGKVLQNSCDSEAPTAGWGLFWGWLRSGEVGGEAGGGGAARSVSEGGAGLTLFPPVPRSALRETAPCRWSWKASTSCGDSWKKLLEEAWSV